MKYITRYVHNTSIEAIVEKLTIALKAEGFIVINEIDLKEILANELAIHITPYHILSTLNYTYFYELLKCEDKVGLIFPATIIIEKVNDRIKIISIDPDTYGFHF